MDKNKNNEITYAELVKMVDDLEKIVEKNEKHLEDIDRELETLRETQNEIDNKLDLYGTI